MAMMLNNSQKTSRGITILNEKPLHAALKQWYAQPEDRLEELVDGFIIDIVRGDLLVEIQTRNFAAIKRKLTELADHHPVRLVYPVARDKWIVKLAEDGHSQLNRRKSPKRGDIEHIFEELVSFPELLLNPNFSIEVLLIQEEEIRRHDTARSWRRKGWVTHERRLLKVVEQRSFQGNADIVALIPRGLSETFTASDLAIAIGTGGFPYNFAMLSPHPEIQDITRRYCADTDGRMIGCWAITEPDHGSDWLLIGEQSKDPKLTPQLRAIPDGDGYVLNGQKAAWVSNGTIATHAALFFNLDPTIGMEGNGIAVISLDLPGITRGAPLNKMGQRALNQGEIFFDNVRISKENIICSDPVTYTFMSETTLSSANAGMGSVFVGCAQAALDEALQYTQQRVQGGKVIFEHQSVKARLFEMFTLVEAARSLSRRVAVFNSQTQVPHVQYSIASKIFATETAFKVASMAIQLFGGIGLSRESVIEKIFRDARAAMIEDGVNETLALGGAEKLRD